MSEDRKNAQRRAWWLKTMHQWHWISSGLCLLCMLAFSITGITLNHAAQIDAHPSVHTRKEAVPAPVLAALEKAAASAQGRKPAPQLPDAAREWVSRTLHVDVAGREPEWSAGEVYVALPRPGGDAWLRIDLAGAELEYELTDRGWISYFNDLHKGRNTGVAWSWLIDIFAGACLLFCITGLVILKFHAASRPMTWPVVGAGVVVPIVLALLFIH